MRKRRAANREKLRQASQKWRNANLEKARQSTRAYREANREKVRALQRKYDAAKRARAKERGDARDTGAEDALRIAAERPASERGPR
jgi:hypothetical protein